MPEETGRTRQVGVLLDAAKVRSEMAVRGWSQRELAAKDKADVSQMTISNLLAGKRVSGDTARKIAQAFADNPPVLEGWIQEKAS